MMKKIEIVLQQIIAKLFILWNLIHALLFVAMKFFVS